MSAAKIPNILQNEKNKLTQRPVLHVLSQRTPQSSIPCVHHSAFQFIQSHCLHVNVPEPFPSLCRRTHSNWCWRTTPATRTPCSATLATVSTGCAARASRRRSTSTCRRRRASTPGTESATTRCPARATLRSSPSHSKSNPIIIAKRNLLVHAFGKRTLKKLSNSMHVCAAGGPT